MRCPNGLSQGKVSPFSNSPVDRLWNYCSAPKSVKFNTFL